MIGDALSYLLETVFHLFVLAALLRFFMQVFRAPFRNPIAQFVAGLTDFVVKPLRRVVPGFLGLDLASFFAAWLAEFILVFLLLWIAIAPAFPAASAVSALFFMALVKLARLSLYLLIGVVFIQAILSWVNPYHPIAPFFDALTRPFLRPLRRIIPPIGGVDITPLVILVLCQLAIMVPVTWLEVEAQRLLKWLAAA